MNDFLYWFEEMNIFYDFIKILFSTHFKPFDLFVFFNHYYKGCFQIVFKTIHLIMEDYYDYLSNNLINEESHTYYNHFQYQFYFQRNLELL